MPPRDVVVRWGGVVLRRPLVPALFSRRGRFPCGVTTVAGSGQLGWRDGPVLEAQFRTMGSFSLDPRRPGALVAVEFLLHCILSVPLLAHVVI